MNPAVLDLCNRRTRQANTEVSVIPDVPPLSLGSPKYVFADFAKRYSSKNVESTKDAVLTTFVLDACEDALAMIRAISNVLRPGGIWANFGSVSYKTFPADARAPVPNICFAWSEIRKYIDLRFEVIGEVEWRSTGYHSDKSSMMMSSFDCCSFVVRRTTAEQSC